MSTSAGQETVPPPVYQAAQAKTSPRYGSFDEERQQLTDEGEDWKIEETVAQSSVEVRHAFIRKVYSLLFVQILATAAVGGLLRTDSGRIPSLIAAGSFATLFSTYAFRHRHPHGILSLSAFTLFEAYAVGSAVSFYQTDIVLQALLITLVVFIGLTLFVWQSKWDFSSLGPWLGVVLLVFFGATLVQLFVPFGKTVDLVYASCGVLLFSLYLLYDTHQIMNRLSPDDVLIGVISLYLDILNLFLMILRILNSQNRN